MPRRILRKKPISNRTTTHALDGLDDPFTLAAHLLKINTKPSQNTYGSYMRVSALAEGCVRERVLGYLNKLRPKKERWSPQLGVTFDIGNAFHWWLQNDPYNSYFSDRRVGFWRCLACNHKLFGGPPRKKCKRCGASHKAREYEETTLLVKEPYRASGHVDMYLRLTRDSSHVRITDFKSVNRKEFDHLACVRGKDAIQLTGYMMLSEVNPVLPKNHVSVDTERALIVYIAKEHIVQGLPFKIYHVDRNKVWDATVLSLLRQFTAGVTGGALPDVLPDCRGTDWGSARAKYCPAGGICKSCA